MNTIKLSLIGNPNCGKTTLFNAYTGLKYKVGNWAGVTVEKKEAMITHNDSNFFITDLPGIYSLTTYSIEEKVTREYLLSESDDIVLNLVDASNLERNLYLTTQLIELGKPMIILLNMMDIAQKEGIDIDVEELQNQLGVPVVPVIATKKSGLTKVLTKAIELYQNQELYKPKNIIYSKDVEKDINYIESEIIKYTSLQQNLLRWHAIKWLEFDEEIHQKIPLDVSIDNIEKYEKENIIIKQKYEFILKLLEKVITYVNKKDNISDKVDRILTHNWFGIPIFLSIMAVVFLLTFNIGNIFSGYLENLFSIFSEWVINILSQLNVSEWMVSLIVEGIIGGVGGILVFLPNIAILFFCMALLEDSGYMARVAYIMDRLMKKVGLSGKAFIPLILGFGCSVPAIMTARTLENEKDRIITMLIIPFISCNAKLPIYILFSKMFFKGYEVVVAYSLYLLGVIIAMIAAFIFSKILKNINTPLILELPSYKKPELNTTNAYVLEKVKGYAIKAGTVIFAASIINWFLINYNFSGPVEMTNSIGASIGKVIAPIFSLSGFGNWQAALSLIAGVAGKEIVASSMSVIYGLSETASQTNIDTFAMALKASGFTSLSAYAFMVFSLLYTPCVAAIGVFKKETNSWKWTFFLVVYQCLVAWTVSVIIYQIGNFILY